MAFSGSPLHLIEHQLSLVMKASKKQAYRKRYATRNFKLTVKQVTKKGLITKKSARHLSLPLRLGRAG
jgi:hypothetical protein